MKKEKTDSSRLLPGIIPEDKAKKTRDIFIGLFYLIAGSFIGGIAINVFYVPIKLTMGGVSGIASIVFQLTGQGEFLGFGVLVALLNLPLLILGWVKIGFKFVWRSIVGTFVYSYAIDVSEPITSAWFSNYLDLPTSTGNRPDLMIFCLFGGILYGVSMGMILKGGYTTGGTDILGVIIHRKYQNISIGTILMALDFMVVVSTLFFYKDSTKNSIILAMYSFVAMWFTSKFTDVTLEGLDFSRTVYIISDHKEEIASAIFSELDRSATLIHADGMYTGESKNMIFCVVSSRQLPKLKKLVKEIDDSAFLVVSEAKEVQGEGWATSSGADFLA